MKDIKIAVSEEAYRRLQEYPDKPRQQWGKRNTPEFYGHVLQMAMDGDSFKLREAQHRIQRLEASVRSQQAQIRGLEFRLQQARPK